MKHLIFCFSPMASPQVMANQDMHTRLELYASRLAEVEQQGSLSLNASTPDV